MKQVQVDIKEIKEILKGFDEGFVTRVEFRPVQKVVYGMVGTALSALLLSIIYLVIKI